MSEIISKDMNEVEVIEDSTEESFFITPIKTNKTKTENKIQRTEVQAHGFLWEHDILKNVYGLSDEEIEQNSYTAKHDLQSSFNKLDNCNVSIKTVKFKGEVCMGDYLRVFDSVNSGEPLHMIVIYYTQIESNIKKLHSIIEVNLTGATELLFGKLTRENIKTLDETVKSIPQKRKPTQEEHDNMYKIRDELLELCGSMFPRIKCDSTQSRLQGAIPFAKFQDLIVKHPEILVSKSDTNEFRGGTISLTVNSSKRQFNKKK
jgi:hypothetical protein